MNDSLLFLACMTIFGLAMLAVGWALRGERDTRRFRGWVETNAAPLRPDPTDEAGA